MNAKSIGNCVAVLTLVLVAMLVIWMQGSNPNIEADSGLDALRSTILQMSEDIASDPTCAATETSCLNQKEDLQ